MNAIVRLCKKVSDDPGETKGAWKSVPCCICGVALRATDKATDTAKKFAVNLNAVCFDCAIHGPEYVLKRIGSCAKVSGERKG